jgi:hypothetical protein
VTRHLNCESNQSSVCIPEKQEAWQKALILEGDERQRILAETADHVRDNFTSSSCSTYLPFTDTIPSYGGLSVPEMTNTCLPTSSGSPSDPEEG